MNDMMLAMLGTEVSVSDENHLRIYSRAPDSTAPCKQWYIDPDPNAPRRPGYLAIRQRLSGCLAHILEENATNTGTVKRLS